MAVFSFAKDDEGINIMNDSPTPSGLPSWINLNQRYLDELARLRAGGSANHFKILNLRFQMAKTLIHELAVSTPHLIYLGLDIVSQSARHVIQAVSPLCCFIALFGSLFALRTHADLETLQHAVSNARNRKYLENCKTERALRRWADLSRVVRTAQDPVSNEDLFEDENSAETGYSWEAWVFGGRIELDHLDASNPLMVSKWPSFLGSTEYLRRGGWKSSVTRYPVSMHYLLNMNRQGFWDNIAAGDTTALYIQKKVGIKVPCPYPDIDPDWNASDSSEGIWVTDRQRSRGSAPSPRVSRMIPNWITEDPSSSRANESGEEKLKRETKEFLARLR